MKPPLPMGPPDVAELRDLIDQWAEFTGDLERKDYTFDLDNWRNDVALNLDAADAAFKTGTRVFKRCIWGHGTQKKEKWTPETNWWYFRTPLRSNAQLEDELATVR